MKKERLIKEWLSHAISDFELARKGRFSKKVRYDTLCFHAQQTAEKSIKMLLVFYDKPFPKTHNIEHLLKLLKEEKIVIPKTIEKSKILSDYAVETRYPDDFDAKDEIDKKEYKQAVALAAKVLEWAKQITNKRSDKLF